MAHSICGMVWYISLNATSPSAHDRLTVSQPSIEEGCRLQRHRNASVRGAQPSQSDRDESAYRGFGRQAASCCEGIETVVRKLLRRDITPEVAGLGALGQQVADNVREVLLRQGEVLISM